jgi:hypothetical protein
MHAEDLEIYHSLESFPLTHFSNHHWCISTTQVLTTVATVSPNESILQFARTPATSKGGIYITKISSIPLWSKELQNINFYISLESFNTSMSQEQYSLKNSRCVSLCIELASLNLLIHACMQGSATETQTTYLKV